MALQIIRGKRPGATRAIIYGTEGIGKSTLAAQIPDSLIVDTEDGTGQIDAARVMALDWRSVEHAVKELVADDQGFKAVIIDSADWLEKALIEHMLKSAGKQSIEDYGFGKGYTMLQEHVSRFLSLVDQLIAKGIHVVFVAHSKTVRTSPPDQTDGFDRYELKLTKQVAPLLKEWADLIIFANYKLQIVEGTDGRLKAQGGKERIMYTTRSAAWDAKNRYNLPDELPWGNTPQTAYAQIAAVFASAAPRAVAPKPVAAVQPMAPTLPVAENALPPVYAKPEQIARLMELHSSPVGLRHIASALEAINGMSVDELLEDEAVKLIAAIEAENATNAATVSPLPNDVADWLDANAEAVNAYLLKVKWIQPGQGWWNLTAEQGAKIVEKMEKFARSAGIQPLAQGVSA